MSNALTTHPLLVALVQLSEQHGHPLSAETLLAGVPLNEDEFSSQQANQLLLNHGLNSQLTTISFSHIPPNQLPALLLLKQNQTTLLLRTDKSSAIVLDQQEREQSIEMDTLEQQYSGQSILISEDTLPDETDETAPPDGRWFWKTLFRGWPVYGESILASLLINLFTLAIPLFVMNVYDRVVPNDALETLWVLAVGALLVITFDFLLRTLRTWFIDLAGKWSDLTLSSFIFEQLTGTRLDARSQSSGAIASHMREFEGLRDFFTSASLTTLIDLPFLMIFLIAIWLIGGPIVLIPVLAIPTILLTALIVQIPLHKAVSKTFKESTQKHALLVETLSAAETIKSENAEKVVQKKWEKTVEKLADSGTKSKFWSTFTVNFTTFTHQFTTIALVVYGVHQISAGEMSVGGLIACTILTGRALAPLSAISSLLIRFRQSAVALRALNQLMHKPVDRPASTHYLQRPEIKGEIEFRQLQFHYPGQKEYALSNLTLKIEAGEHIAIIGKIGSGKSTLQKLLLGLYQPQEGTLLVDNTHLNQLDPNQLRRAIGYVSQEIILFQGTLRENISFGHPQATDQEILEAAQLAGVDLFADQHPDGYDMVIGERGGGLSGGQRQAVAMARALLAKPPIILLDEPTSAMDQQAEQRWKERIQPFLEERTLILVTHRSSLLSLVDRLVVLEDGRVITDSPRAATQKQ